MGVILSLAGTYVLVRYLLFRNPNHFQIQEHPEITELKREIKAWKHSVQMIGPSYTSDEDVIITTIDRKIARLEQKLNRKLHLETLSKDMYTTTLHDLQQKVHLIK